MNLKRDHYILLRNQRSGIDKMSLIYVFFTILFTVYGQLVIKWQVSSAGQLPPALNDKTIFLFKLFFNPWILSGFIAAFMASLCWMAAMTKLPLSYAYPFMSLSFVLVLGLSGFFFSELVTWQKILGMFFIVLGVVVSSQS
jgi:drug/metabolite transporter (DMT)-like permease